MPQNELPLAEHKSFSMICNFPFYHHPPNPALYLDSGNQVFFFSPTGLYSIPRKLKIKLLFYDHRELTACLNIFCLHINKGNYRGTGALF